MTKDMEPSAIQINEQDRIKDGTFVFLEEYRGRRVNQYTTPRGGRHYEVEGYQFDFTSVTSITGVVNKFGIPDYYKRTGIEKAIDIIDKPGARERLELQAKGKNDRARKHKNHTWQTELYEEAKVGPKEAMDYATKFGKDSHDIIEYITMNDMGKEPSFSLMDDAMNHDTPGYTPILQGFSAWLRDSGIEIVASELMVYHPSYKYAGTIDLIGIHPDNPLTLLVIDVKTGGVFDEAAMQISAYAEALEYLVSKGLISWVVGEPMILQLPRERPIKWDADKLYETYKLNDIQGYFDAFDTAHKLRGLLEKEAWSS